MTFQDESNQMAATHPYVRLTAICRRFLSMAEVLHDAIDSRLSIGKPEEVMELSESDADRHRPDMRQTALELVRGKEAARRRIRGVGRI